MDLPALRSATRNSYRVCRLSQNCALVPKKWARRRAVSESGSWRLEAGGWKENCRIRTKWLFGFRRSGGHARLVRRFRGAHAERLQFLAEMLSGMDGGGWHGSSIGLWPISLVRAT